LKEALPILTSRSYSFPSLRRFFGLFGSVGKVPWRREPVRFSNNTVSDASLFTTLGYGGYFFATEALASDQTHHLFPLFLTFLLGGGRSPFFFRCRTFFLIELLLFPLRPFRCGWWWPLLPSLPTGPHILTCASLPHEVLFFFFFFSAPCCSACYGSPFSSNHVPLYFFGVEF